MRRSSMDECQPTDPWSLSTGYSFHKDLKVMPDGEPLPEFNLLGSSSLLQLGFFLRLYPS